MSISRSIRVILLSLTTLLLLWNCQTDMSPVARDDTAATDRNVPVTITVVANDTAGIGYIVANTVAVVAGPGHGTAHAQADGTVIYTPATDFVGTDSFSYVVADITGETSNAATVTVTVRAVNHAPVANAGPDINAVTGRPVILDGAQSFDPDRDPLSFAWQFVAVPPTSSVTTASLANAQTAAPSFTPDVDGTYSLELTVSDGTLSSTDQVQVTAVSLSNVPPNANAGQDQTAQVRRTVVLLDGRGSQDPDNGPQQPLTFQWSFVAVPSESILTTANLQGATTPLANFIPDVVGVYRVSLQVSDGRDTSQAEVQITAALPNVAPNADAGRPMVVQLGAAVTLNGTASHDPDKGPQLLLTYQWTLVSQPAASRLTNASIQEATTATPSFTPDVAGFYVLRLDVSDGDESDFAQVLVKANVAPVAADDTFDTKQDQPLTVLAPGVLSNDTDGNNDPLTVVMGNTVSHGALTLNDDGSFTYTPTTDFLGTDSFTYQANDGSVDSNMAAVTVTVTEPNGNHAPVVKAATFSIAENSTAGTVVGTVTFTDPDAGQSHIFTISAGNSSNAFAVANTGQLTVATSTALDFEATRSFSLTVQVTDNGRPAKSGSAIITVNLTNVNEAPVVNRATFTVQENSANGTVVGTVTFTDPDAGQSHTFAIVGGGNTGGVFTINPSTGQLIVANSAALNIGTTPSFSLTVQVTDNGTPVLSGSAIITINLTNVNHAPSFTVGPNQMVNEDAGPQTVIGWATAISAGPANESGQTLTFNITSNTNPVLFSTGPAVSSAGGLTYTLAANANGMATITVTLSDNGGTANGGVDTSAPQTFSITVNQVNDAPSFTVGPNQTVLDDAGPQSVANWATGISAGPIDEAGQTLMFHVTNNTNASLFAAGPAVSSSGLLTYTPAVNANGTATITLVLQDNGGTANGGVNTSLPQTFTITVTAVNDPPTANGFTNLPAQAGIPITYPAGKLGGTDVESGTTVTIETTPDGMTGGAVTINADGSFVFTPLPSTADGMAQFTYHVCDNGIPGPGLCSSSATVSFRVAGPAIYFVKSGAVGAGTCTLGNECTLTTALTDIGVMTDAKIFIGDSGTYSNTVTLNSDGWLIGQGVTGMTFDTLFGISAPAQGTLAARPSLGGTRPTVQGTVTLATDSEVRGLNISTTSATGLSGGTVSGVTVSEVSVTTTSATAVHLNGTNGKVSLTSVSAGNTTTDPDPVNGISLTNTTGSFTVTGGEVSDPIGTGGTITNTMGDSISLTNVVQASFSRMNITNSGANGIFGTGVNGFVVNWCSFSNNGNATGEGAIRFGDETNNSINGLVGSSPAGSNPTKITNSLLSGSFERAVSIFNTSGTLTELDVTNSTFEMAAHGSGFLIETRGNAVATVSMIGSTFRNNVAAGMQGSALDQSNLTLSVTGSAFQTNMGSGFLSETRGNAVATVNVTGSAFQNNVAAGIQGSALAQSNLTLKVLGATNTNTFTDNNEGIRCSNQDDADMTCEVSHNIFTGHPGNAIFVGNGTALTSLASLNGRIENNDVTMPPVAETNLNHTILSSLSGMGSSSALLISGNKVSNNGRSNGIHVNTPNSGTCPNFSVTVTNNNVRTAASGVNAISLNANQFARACFNVRSNTTAAPSGIGVQVRQFTSPSGCSSGSSPGVSLEKRDGSISDTASVVLAANNPTPPATGNPPTFVAGTVSVVEDDICVLPTLP